MVSARANISAPKAAGGSRQHYPHPPTHLQRHRHNDDPLSFSHHHVRLPNLAGSFARFLVFFILLVAITAVPLLLLRAQSRRF